MESSIRKNHDDPPIPRCELDSRECITLASILESFSVVSEEHAWALCYQCAKCAKNILGDPSQRGLCEVVTETDHLLIHRDGTVHPNTFIASCDPGAQGKGPPRTKCSCECKIIANLAAVIFHALDFGLADDEERHLSADLESLLDAMASAGESVERPETDDEGIERDSGDSDDDRVSSRAVNFDGILEICTRRLGSSATNHINCNGSSSTGSSAISSRPTADAHYKAVCRALVAEALELSTFLHKVGTEQLHTFSSSGLSQSGYPSSRSVGLLLEHDPDLRKLNFADWANCWFQVMDELRLGVQLKKVDSPYHKSCSHGPPVVYELTPYEMLMEDIRSQRYKLNKVVKDGALPRRIKKDAHDLILDFIRSRPPLKKVEDRVLAPARKTISEREKLMEQIKERPSLKPITRKESARLRNRRMNSSDMTELNSSNVNNNKSPSSSTSTTNQHQSEQQPSQRRLIKADLAELYSFDTKDEDEDNFPEDSPKENGTCFFGHICPEGSQSQPVTPFKRPAEPRFEDGDDNKKVDFRRRHTICNPTNREEHGSTLITFPFEYTNSVNVFTSLQFPRASPILHRRKAKLPHSVSKSSLQEEFFQSNHWQTAIECLSLNLEEVVHIRNVLTKAELESLPVDCSLKEDVEKGKVCFLCLKTRFSLIFGPWGNTCKLCKRAVCAKCCSKMRIPTDHFAKVPVSTLSPTISPREEEKDYPGSKSLTPTRMDSLTPPNNSMNSVGSAPTSPSLSRKSDSDSHSGQQGVTESRQQDHQETDYFEQSNGPHSLPTVTSISLGLMAFKRRGFGRRKDADKTEKLKGSLMIVCHDCKAMVLQIIRSSRAKKAGALRSNMTLDINKSV